MLLLIIFVLWGAPEHQLRGAIVRFDDDDDDDDDEICQSLDSVSTFNQLE